MGDPNLAPDGRFTYRHYRSWPDEERWELIDGVAWSMSPAPRRRHQEISGRLFTEISVFLKGKPCKAYEAPDLVVEILSPSTSRKDQRDKFDRYARAGVREYWVVDPEAWSVWVYRLASPGSFDRGELRERLRDVSPIASRARALAI